MRVEKEFHLTENRSNECHAFFDGRECMRAIPDASSVSEQSFEG